jgi:phenylacetate-CoA ligase
LRYDTGDLAIAAAGRCPCGRTLPLVASIEGRARTALHLADGRVVTTRAIMDGLAGAGPPGRYLLLQESLNRFRLEIADPGSREAFVPLLRILLGDVELAVDAGMSPARLPHKTDAVLAAGAPQASGPERRLSTATTP